MHPTTRTRRDAPVGLPRPQQARRDRIVDAALELLAERNHDEIHMRHVAERAEVALGTLYRYFPAKERLFAAVLVAWGERFAAARRTPRHADVPPDAAARAVLRAAASAFERNPHFLAPVMALQSSSDPVVAACYAQYAATTTAVLRDAIAEPDAATGEIVELLLLSALTSLLRQWSLGQCSMAEVRRRLDACVDRVVAPTPAVHRAVSA